MKKFTVGVFLSCIAISAAAQFGPPGPPVPSALDVAAIPGLSADQQSGVRKIMLQRRDAVDALMAKQRADFDAVRQKDRSERERIDDTAAASLRKLLGDDGLRKFAEWQGARREMRGPGPGMPPGAHGRMPHAGHDAPPPDAGGAGPAPADDNE